MQRLEQKTNLITSDITYIWNQALDAPMDIEETWIHGDLHPCNVLFENGASQILLIGEILQRVTVQLIWMQSGCSFLIHRYVSKLLQLMPMLLKPLYNGLEDEQFFRCCPTRYSNREAG